MKVLIAGASGFLGSRTVEQLRKRDAEITALSRDGSRQALVAQGCKVVVHELGGEAAVPDLAHHDFALFMAQSSAHRAGPAARPEVVRVNVLGLVQFLDAARRAGVRRLLYFSSGSVYAPSFEPLCEAAPLGGTDFYALSKLLGEELAASYRDSFEVLVLRVFALYGPGQRGRMIPDIVARVAQGKPVVLSPRDAKESLPGGLEVTPCYVDDAARITVELAARHVQGVLNLAGPDRVSVREIAEQAGRVLGRTPLFEVHGTSRTGNLVGDVSQLLREVGGEFVPFSAGLEAVVRAGIPG
jgi:nucleoside-diphosphate-sugar epimerase